MDNLNIADYFNSHIDLFRKISIIEIENAISIIKNTFLRGKKIITCGNGGSASTASHYITDWNKMVNVYSSKKFRGFSLSDNIGLVTAYGNDTTFDNIFKGQLESILDEGDLLVAISGSGQSRNIINAIEYANNNGANTLGVLGYDGGNALELCKYTFLVPSFDMQLCEDIHLMFGHIVMKRLISSLIKNE